MCHRTQANHALLLLLLLLTATLHALPSVTAAEAAAGVVSIEPGRGVWTLLPVRSQVLFSHALFGAMLLPAHAAVHYVKLGGSGCSAYPADTDFSSHIVMVDRGGCAFYRKALNVQAARGVMMMVANHEDTLFGMTVDPQEAVPGTPVVKILCVLLPAFQAQRLKAMLASGPLAMQVGLDLFHLVDHSSSS